jgi:hypothetical protein
MLLDLVTAILVFTAKDEIAARQFLRELTHRTNDSVPGTSRNAVYDYQRCVLEKSTAIASVLTGTDTRAWLENLF